MDPGFYNHNRKRSPRKDANVFSQFTFWWLKELFFKGFHREIELDDIYAPLNSHKSYRIGDQYQNYWDTRKAAGGTPSLLVMILKMHGNVIFVFNIVFTLFHVALRVGLPLCLGVLISYFSPGQTDITREEAYMYATGVVLCMLFSVFIVHPLINILLHVAMQIRVGCCSLVYRKVLKLDMKSNDPNSDGLSGKVINLLTNDANRFDLALLFLLDLIRAPIEGVIVIYLMYYMIGYSALIGVAFLLLFIPFQAWLGRLTAEIRRKSAMKTDERIRMMNEIIQGIQVIKMYAWEHCFADLIRWARKKEMKLIKKIAWIRALTICCVTLNTRISIFISILAYIAFDNAITASKVFVLFSLYDLIKLTLVEFFPLAIMAVLDCYVSIQRIQEFLSLSEVYNVPQIEFKTENDDVYSDDKYLKYVKSNGTNTKNVEKDDKNDLTLIENAKSYLKESGLEMINVNSYWKVFDTDGNEKKTIALDNISLKVLPGQLIAVIGQVGSGKSTLLHAILGEIPVSEESIIKVAGEGTVSYCSQQAWLFEASIRQNILFGLPMEPQRYKNVIKCCQLERDLQLLPFGDKTIVGERGVSLSGGQKARVSLARCVYRRTNLYLLDDPLSAVDAHVSKALYDSCMRGFLKSSSVILVTHQVQQLVKADKLYLMESGKIVFEGTYDELFKSKSNFVKLLPVENEASKESPISEDFVENLPNKKNRPSICSVSSKVSLSSLNVDATDVAKQMHEQEQQKAGSVDVSVYLSLGKSAGGVISMVTLGVLFILGQASMSACDLWLSQWVNLEEVASANFTETDNHTQSIESEISSSTKFTDDWSTVYDGDYNAWGLTRESSVYIYSTLLAVCIVFSLSKLLMFFGMCITASINLHNTMFIGITRATMWFFNNNASGRILNRFSKDMGSVDMILPAALVDCFGFLLEIIGILIVVCIVNFWLLIPTTVLVVLLYLIRMVYIRSSRSLKRLEGISRSPAFTHVNATLSGLTTIRASEGAAQILTMEFDRHQDIHSSVWTLVLNSNRAFAFWMDIACCAYLAAVTYSFLLFSSGETFGGKVGLAITQVIGLVGMCQWGMRQTAEVENLMTSVERINEYSQLDPEPPLETDMELVNKKYQKMNIDSWPQQGRVDIKNLYLTYDKGENPKNVLNDISLVVESGEKVGIVGRTGAGKSSIIAALYRLASTEGAVYLDGVDTRDVGLHSLRTGMSIIPQEPMLFSGTLRQNLDPWQKQKDEELWNALEEVELKTMVSELPGGLNSHVSDGGSNLSVGQRQLLCLARASLRGAKILLMDEATANVDHETDQLIQKTIKKKFSDKTVITIAHRLYTIMDSDKVVVMDNGRVVEVGHPFELLNVEVPQNLLKPPTINRSLSALSASDENSSQPDIEELLINMNSGKGMFKSLVMQAGTQTYDILYSMAEKSYNNRLQLKKDN